MGPPWGHIMGPWGLQWPQLAHGVHMGSYGQYGRYAYKYTHILKGVKIMWTQFMLGGESWSNLQTSNWAMMTLSLRVLGDFVLDAPNTLIVAYCHECMCVWGVFSGDSWNVDNINMQIKHVLRHSWKRYRVRDSSIYFLKTNGSDIRTSNMPSVHKGS